MHALFVNNPMKLSNIICKVKPYNQLFEFSVSEDMEN